MANLHIQTDAKVEGKEYLNYVCIREFCTRLFTLHTTSRTLVYIYFWITTKQNKDLSINGA